MHTDFDLSDRVAVVTGASSGIGAATARRLAAAGARVALLARRADRVEALAAELGALAVPVDLTDPDALAAAADRVTAELGPPDLVVANAGALRSALVADQPRADWERMVAVNVGGLFATVHAFLPGLLEAGRGGRAADLVTVSSLAARGAPPKFAAYGATKAAVSSFADGLRREVAPHVRVTDLEPGATDTELRLLVGNDADVATFAAWFAEHRTLSADDVAEAIAWIVTRPGHVHVRSLVVAPTAEV